MTTIQDYENARARVELLNADIETKRKEIMARVQDDLDALTTEYQPMMDAAQADVTYMEQKLKAEVIASGEGVKGEWYHAIYIKGRESWDSKRLDGFAAAHPEVLAFKKIGEPTVSIRLSKG